jgi:hypothetical protein
MEADGGPPRRPAWRSGPRPADGDSLLIATCKGLCGLHCGVDSPLLKALTPIQQLGNRAR